MIDNSSIFDSRQDNDYEDFYTPMEEESFEQLTDGKDFINEVEEKIELILKNKIELPEIDI
jgi:hypothetical protein